MVSHVFTQITAQFEARPLFTPSIVRRQIEEASRIATQLHAPLIEAARVDGAQLGAEEDISHPPAIAPAESIIAAPDQAAVRLRELEESYRELAKRLQKQEEIGRKLEEDLEQERAGRAETERKLGETEAELKMFHRGKPFVGTAKGGCSLATSVRSNPRLLGRFGKAFSASLARCRQLLSNSVGWNRIQTRSMNWKRNLPTRTRPSLIRKQRLTH